MKARRQEQRETRMVITSRRHGQRLAASLQGLVASQTMLPYQHPLKVVIRQTLAMIEYTATRPVT